MRYIIPAGKTPIVYREQVREESVVQHFTNWCTNQDAEHHIAWAGISLLATAAVLFPLTMGFILLNGFSFPLIITAMIALVLVVVLNLAAMPTRYTIPAFFLGILIDLGVIITSIIYSA